MKIKTFLLLTILLSSSIIGAFSLNPFNWFASELQPKDCPYPEWLNNGSIEDALWKINAMTGDKRKINLIRFFCSKIFFNFITTIQESRRENERLMFEESGETIIVKPLPTVILESFENQTDAKLFIVLNNEYKKIRHQYEAQDIKPRDQINLELR